MEIKLEKLFAAGAILFGVMALTLAQAVPAQAEHEKIVAGQNHEKSGSSDVSARRHHRRYHRFHGSQTYYRPYGYGTPYGRSYTYYRPYYGPYRSYYRPYDYYYGGPGYYGYGRDIGAGYFSYGAGIGFGF